MSCGGYSEAKPVDAEVNAVITHDAVKDGLRTHLGSDSVEVVQYKTQVVAGLNFKALVKAHDGAEHTVTIHRPLPHTGAAPSVKSVEAGNHL